MLEYAGTGLTRPKRESLTADPAFFLFAAGAFLPFCVLAMVIGESWPLGLGGAVMWGECGALIIAIKIRAAITSRALRRRGAGVLFCAGIANSLLLFAIVRMTTAREHFSPAFDEGTAILLAFALTGVVAAVLAMLLIRDDGAAASVEMQSPS